jgi:hypothetical protein
MESEMRRARYDRDLLASKIRWEGGVAATLDYGLRAADIGDPALRTAWTRLQKVHAQLHPLILEFENLLRQPTGKRGD